jgi:ATP-binding cassette, subfamily B, bacterial
MSAAPIAQQAWWRRLARYSAPSRPGMTAVVALMLLGVFLDLLKPWPLKLIVDSVLGGQPLPSSVSWLSSLPGAESPSGLLAWLSGVTILLFVASQGIAALRGYVQSGVGSRMVYQLGADLFEHLQRLSLRFHGRQAAGDLVRRVTTDSSSVRELMIGVILPILSACVTLVMMFVVMWKVDRNLALLALLVAPVLGVLIRVFDRPMTERAYQYQNLEGDMMALTEQTLTALPVVQAFGRETYNDELFHNLAARTLQAYLRSILAQLQFNTGVGSVTAVGTAAMMILGGFQVLRGTLSVGTLLVLLSYLASLYAPLETLAYISMGFASASARARRVLEVLDEDDAVRDSATARELPARSTDGVRGAHVCLERVTFGYEPGRPVLSDITLEARPGETIALVGQTGAGKSTLVSLIPRFFDPSEGRITYDGQDIREIKLASLRSHVAFVLQDPFLLPLSVAGNIAYGRPGANSEEIAAAAAAANVDEFVRGLPEGFDTIIGERGSTLSVGQRQRIAIARALLKDAPVLILDEPTSALDASTEGSLMEAMQRLMAGRTTFIIAHRLSTVRAADRIVVLEAGRIAEMGTHRELLRSGGLYEHLYRLQLGPDTALGL